MTIDPTTLYRPSELPLSPVDLETIEAHRPRTSWCYDRALKRHEGGDWQWYGRRDDGKWHPWGVMFSLYTA